MWFGGQMNKTIRLGSKIRSVPPNSYLSRNFQPSKRQLAVAIQLLFTVGAGQALAAPCALDGATVVSATTNSVLCDNSGTLTVSSGGSLTNTSTGTLNNFGSVVNNTLLTNNGVINNTGTITSTGTVNGNGTLNSTGSLNVVSGNVSIANSSNLSSGTLTGGTWIVGSTTSGSKGSKAFLSIGSGAITTNNANVQLVGAGASFSQLNSLTDNYGSLTVRDGASFTRAALNNTGTLMVASGGTVNLASSANFSSDTLTGGTWVVDNTGGTSSLKIGSGFIRTNNANIELIGSGAQSSFSQLAGLANNSGSITVGAGATLNNLSKLGTTLTNTGALTVLSGGNITLDKNGNLSNGTLTGGTWVVDGSGGSAATLQIGTGNILTNNANIQLIGGNANFAQLATLANNQGTLTIGNGANYATAAPLVNTGTIVSAAGGTLTIPAMGSKFPSVPLTNNGLIENNGTTIASSNISGKGTFNNAGTLTVLSGANVQIANSTNFSLGTLTGGTWIVDSTGGTKAATLAIGSGNITTNNANIALIGSNAAFNQLTGLQSNQGSLTIGQGVNFTNASLLNTGTLTVQAGGNINLAKSGNVSNGTLTGGTWVVDGSGNSKLTASMVVGSGAITTNNANVALIGAGARFTQIDNLANNNGSLTVSNGAKFASAAMSNSGSLTVASGGIVNIASSGNLANGTLTGGTWVVDNTAGTSSLTVGSSAIRTNSANIELIGSGAVNSFTRLDGLSSNTGSLTIGAGASLDEGGKGILALNNTGTLTVTSGGNANLAKSANLSGGTLTGGTWVVDGSGGSAATMQIGTSNITTNNANIKLIGANANFAQLGALANNQGTLTIANGAYLTTSASLNNTGTIVTSAGSALELYSNKQKLTLTNNGNISTAGTIEGNALNNFTNAGQLTIESTGAVTGFKNFTQNSGVTTLQTGAVLSAASVEFLGGKLTGSGTIDPPNPIVIGSKAVVAPTDLITFEGNTEFNGELDIGVRSATDFGKLNVLGLINFGAGSKIDFNFDQGFDWIESSYAFKFLLADEILGLENLIFDYTGLDSLYSSQLSLECQSSHCDYSLLLTRSDGPSQVPEPSTLLLSALGLLAFALGRRRCMSEQG